MKKMTRRDRCYFIGKRALGDGINFEIAWKHLAATVEFMSEKDIPKFNDLLNAIRKATIAGRQNSIQSEEKLLEWREYLHILDTDT